MFANSISKISVFPLLKKIVALERTPMLSLPATGGKKIFLSSSVLAFVLAILGSQIDSICKSKTKELATVGEFP